MIISLDSPEWATLLVRLANNDATLTSLNLNGSHLGDEAAYALALVIAGNSSLKELSLLDNDITAQGIDALQAGLTHNSVLQRLIINSTTVLSAVRSSAQTLSQANQLTSSSANADQVAQLEQVLAAQALKSQQLAEQLHVQQAAIAQLLEQQQLFLKTQNQAWLVGKKTDFPQLLEAALAASQSAMSTLMQAQLPAIIESQFAERLASTYAADMTATLDSSAYATQLEAYQLRLHAQIIERQQLIDLRLNDLQCQQDKLHDEHSPLYAQYQAEQKNLKEQQNLQQPETVRTFYNNIEQKLGAYFIGTMSLASNLVKHEASKTEKVIKCSSKVASQLAGCIPGVGGVAKAIVSCVAGVGSEAFSIYQDQKRATNSQNTLNSFISVDGAGKMAELVARRLAQHYQSQLLSSALSPERAKKIAHKAADLVFKSMRNGELDPYVDASLEDKIAYLVKTVSAALVSSGAFKKTTAAFFSPANLPSPANHRQVQDVSAQLRQLKEQAELQDKLNAQKLREHDQRLAMIEKGKVEEKQQPKQFSPQ